jgi:uncharacterized protein
MKSVRQQRLRDPVHGLIVFADEGRHARRDQAAWALLNTPEFQRLRRIRQLGLTEFVFPGATHTRFAHSIGVFHTARMLVGILQKLLPDAEFDPARADLAVLAALLHDLGHGPFSHAFEVVQKERGHEKSHETWTADIINNRDGSVRPILERFHRGIAKEIAELITAEVPQDIYHAIVSSSFDADRLDYLRRDRLMTGSGAGAIDFDWLLDNLRIAEIRRGGDDDVESEPIVTFCLDEKALQAAESFLIARYHLFEQVYLHKTTRGMEAMLRALLAKVTDVANSGNLQQIGLGPSDPLARFFSEGGETVRNYLELDDFAVWTAIGCMARGGDPSARELACRLRERRLYKALDINTVCPIRPDESADETDERRQREILRIQEKLGERSSLPFLIDSAPIGIYGEIGEDEARTHNMLAIRLHDGSTREITQVSPTIRALGKRRRIVRFYFPDQAMRDEVQLGGG